MRKLLLTIILLRSVFCFAQVTISSVNDALNFAEVHSKSHKLQAAAALLNQRKARLSFQEFLPTFNFAVSESDSSKKGSADTRSKNLLFSVTQPIFNGGRSALAYEMAKFEADFQFAEYGQLVQSFKAELVRQYYEYLAQVSLVEIRANLVENADAQLAILKMEYDLGMRLESDYLEYLISVMKLKDELRHAERDARQSLRAFKISLGADVESEIEVAPFPFPDERSDIFYEPHASYLWDIVKINNFELRKDEANLQWSKKRLEYSRRGYLPQISLTGGVSFSGTRYPLTEPSYSLKVNVSFTGSQVLPLQISNGYGFGKDGLSSVSNSASADLTPLPAYFVSRKLDDVTLAREAQSVSDNKVSLHESLFSMIAAHDNCLDEIQRIRETLALMERKLEISKMQVENGEMTRLDYLEELEAYAEQEMNLAQAQCSLLSATHEIELAADLPLGGLKDALENAQRIY